MAATIGSVSDREHPAREAAFLVTRRELAVLAVALAAVAAAVLLLVLAGGEVAATLLAPG